MKPEINKAYKENQKTIKMMCCKYSIWFKVDYTDLISKSNELFISIYNKYNYEKITFKKYLYIQLNNYFKMYCKKEILRKKREDLIYYQNHTINEIKIKEKKELSKLSKQILDYCLIQNTKKEVVYNKRKYKDKIYNYPVKQRNITISSIRDHFKSLYTKNEMINAFNEIKYLLKKELI